MPKGKPSSTFELTKLSDRITQKNKNVEIEEKSNKRSSENLIEKLTTGEGVHENQEKGNLKERTRNEENISQSPNSEDEHFIKLCKSEELKLVERASKIVDGLFTSSVSILYMETPCGFFGLFFTFCLFLSIFSKKASKIWKGVVKKHFTHEISLEKSYTILENPKKF